MNSWEWTCLWYLRLNGYFTIPNFYAHGRPGPLTEVDVLGVRFQYSSELEDDDQLRIPKDVTDVVFAEAKSKQIGTLNGPWGSPDRGALDYVLRRVGIVPVQDIQKLADDLYKKRKASEHGFSIRIVVFAESITDDFRKERVTFVEWKHALEFIHKRFRDNKQLKADHEAWDDFGQYLWGQLNRPTPPDSDAFFDGWVKRNRAAD